MSENRFLSDDIQRVLNASPCLNWIINLRGGVEFQNSKCGDYVSQSTLENINRIIPFKLDSEEDSHAVGLNIDALTSESFNAFDAYLFHSSGTRHWFRIEIKPVRDKQNQILYWLGCAVEIQAQKELEETLKAERVLREQFILTLTHDLRNPFSAAKITAQLLARQAHSPEKIKSLSGRIIGSLNRANQMIDNLLDANRVKAGTPLYLEMDEVNCLSSVEEALKEVRGIYGERFKLHTQLSELKCHASGDAIKRIIENLASNAAKFGDEKSEIQVRVEKSNHQIRISVHNEGNPIPLSELTEILNPHRRVTLADAKKRKGWGLGLILTKGLVEAHGGNIEVSSSQTAGTTFSFNLPLDARQYSQE